MAVGNICQIVSALNFYHIPHVGTIGDPCHQDALYSVIPAAQIAEVFERLGIPLADYSCGWIAVKNIDHLPRIASQILHTASGSCSVVIVC